MGVSRIIAAVLAVCLFAAGRPARAAEPPRAFQVPAGEMAAGLEAYIRQSGVPLIYRVQDVRGLRTHGVAGMHTPEQALAMLLRGTGLKPERDPSGAIALVSSPSPAATSDRRKAGEPGRERPARTTTLDGVLVTAQKHVERVQDVPMAITVLGGGDLDALKIESGGELLRGTPNAAFSKTNFTTHNFQIRGIGTQALSATTDSGVAINYNGMPLARNRFYEQEYFDVNRIEVLRGPQGTLHSRNATAGVVDMIPNLPSEDFEADLKAETGSYDLQRVSGMVNQPITDSLRLRLAGVHSKRDGTDYNTVTSSIFIAAGATATYGERGCRSLGSRTAGSAPAWFGKGSRSGTGGRGPASSFAIPILCRLEPEAGSLKKAGGLASMRRCSIRIAGQVRCMRMTLSVCQTV